ncbi:hypothetical protein [Pseudonocardia sp. MH-G8]|uniref:hypothetical protein n=1 Tax=Pseudonocardia sp. MH-G8 TaxID=1854588 RepID=UPI00117A181A|nr:hypothetical protein [Pseudonocardia sp. MH-G8]
MKPPTVDDKPPAIPFRGEIDQEWSINVARILLWNCYAMPSLRSGTVECWLTDEFAIYLRHVRGDTRLGIRFGELGTNPTTETPPIDSGQEGDYLYWTIFDTPEHREWTDQFGYEWWGDPPEGAWSDAVGGTRLMTFDLRTERPWE